MAKRFLPLLFVFVTLAGAAGVDADGFTRLATEAEAAHKAHNTAEAIALYTKALRANPDWAEGWWAQGNLLYEAARYSEARANFARLTSLRPQAAPAYAMLGLCEFSLADYASALAHIEAGLASPELDKQPQMAGVLHFHKAVSLRLIGRFDRALSELAWFAANGYKSDAIFTEMGLAALRSASLQNELPRDTMPVYVTTGKVAYAMLAGDEPDVHEGMQWLLKTFPQAQNLHLFYGSFLMATQPEAAITQFEEELRLNPESANTYAKLAWTWLNWDEYEKSLPYAEKAVALDAKDALAQYVLGKALVGKAQLESGIEHLRVATQSQPDDLKSHVALATALWQQGDVIGARQQQSIASRLSRAAGTPANRSHTDVE